MISEVVILLMCMCAVVLGMISIGIVMLGNKIKVHEVGGESNNTLASPENATKIVVGLSWVGFIVSFLLFTSDSKVIFIVAIAIIASVMLLMFTTFVFSMAVLSTMNAKTVKRVNPV
jgi:hypothetical protein